MAALRSSAPLPPNENLIAQPASAAYTPLHKPAPPPKAPTAAVAQPLKSAAPKPPPPPSSDAATREAVKAARHKARNPTAANKPPAAPSSKGKTPYERAYDLAPPGSAPKRSEAVKSK